METKEVTRKTKKYTKRHLDKHSRQEILKAVKTLNEKNLLFVGETSFNKLSKEALLEKIPTYASTNLELEILANKTQKNRELSALSQDQTIEVRELRSKNFKVKDIANALKTLNVSLPNHYTLKKSDLAFEIAKAGKGKEVIEHLKQESVMVTCDTVPKSVVASA